MPHLTNVFLSYSGADAALARRLAGDLLASGTGVWLDHWKLKVGEASEQSIERGVAEADFVIVLRTANSVKSDWVRRSSNGIKGAKVALHRSAGQGQVQ